MDAVREQLGRILASDEFVASDRLKQFLRFVVEEALAGRADRLKAYSIAIEVFGRGDSFDPQNDPVVRMEAGKLRRRLEQYYLGAGQGDPVRIEIPKGSYRPIFRSNRDRADDGEGPATDVTPPAHPPRRRMGLWGLGGLVIAALVLFGTVLLWPEAPPSGSETAAAAPQQRGPALIVLPFANLSGDADDVFAAGLTEELISNLMHFGELRLYTSHSSFLEQPSADPVELSKRLGVGYVVKGSVRRAADRIRLTVHLIQADTNQHVWSETYDRDLTPENVLAIQERLAADLSGELAQPYGIINEVTAKSFHNQRPATLFAYECVLRALDYRRTQGHEKFAAARQCLEEAVDRDPGYGTAWALLAHMELDEYRYGYGPGPAEAAGLERALATARRATALDGDNVQALLALSAIQFYRDEFAEADMVHQRLLALSPNNPEVLAQVGWRTAFATDWDAGIALLGQAIERSIEAPEWYRGIMSLHHYHRKDFAAALDLLESSAPARWIWSAVILAATHGQLGNRDQAQGALDGANAMNPGVLRDPRSALGLHNLPEDLIEHLLDGLAKAGLVMS